MPNSLNFISEFSARAGRYKAAGKDNSTDKPTNNGPDASTLGAHFSSLLHKVANQHAEPAKHQDKSKLQGQAEPEQHNSSNTAQTAESTNAQTPDAQQTDATHDTANSNDDQDKPTDPTQEQNGLSQQLTALSGTLQALLSQALPEQSIPTGAQGNSDASQGDNTDVASPSSQATTGNTLSAAIATAGTLGIAGLPQQQNLPDAQAANPESTTAATGAIGETNDPSQSINSNNSSNPGGENIINSGKDIAFSDALQQAGAPDALPATPQTENTLPPELNTTDLSAIPSPESLPLSTQPTSPAKGELDGLHAANSPLPGLESTEAPKPQALGTGENAGNNKVLQTLSNISEKLQALNGKIEAVSENAGDDDTSDADPLSGIASSAPPTGATDSLLAGIGNSQGTAQPLHNQGGNPLTQFVSNAQQPVDQVADGALYSIKNGQKELVIRLNPDNLGEVRINLISHGNQEMSARLIATTQESHDMLKSQIDSLRNTLESQGLQVERLSVVLAGSPESARDFNHHGQQHQTFQQEQNTSHNNPQSFNQQGQPDQNLFNQLAGQFQHKQGFAQQPGGNRTGGFSGGNSILGDAPGKADTPARHNENGNISLLA